MQEKFREVILLKNENEKYLLVISRIIRQDRQKAVRHGLFTEKCMYVVLLDHTMIFFYLIDKLLFINTTITLCSTRECYFYSALQACEQQQFDLMRTSLHTGANLN